jgi:hypothetical protein
MALSLALGAGDRESAAIKFSIQLIAFQFYA